MKSKYQFVKIEKNSFSISILLNRPEVKNAFNPTMISELTEVFQSVNLDPHIGLVILRGAGSIFCAGADLSWMKEMATYTEEENRADSKKLYQMFEALWRIQAPVLGIVEKAAYGGALGLMACCDEVIADEDAQFCFSEVKLGLAPAVISSFITRKCQRGILDSFMTSGKVFKSPVAINSGLVHEIVSLGQIEKTLQNSIEHYKKLSPQAVKATKALLRQAHIPEEKEVCELISFLRVSKEGQEGLAAFFEKRPPKWENQNG